MRLTQFQQLIIDDLKVNGTSTPAEITKRIKRLANPVKHQLGTLMTLKMVANDGFNKYRLIQNTYDKTS